MTDDFDGGWDNRVVLVEVAGGRWVERTPRFPDREAQLRREAALLPWLAPLLPVPVPVPSVLSEDPFTVRYAYLAGSPCSGVSAAQGAEAWHGDRVVSLTRMADQVLPLLPAGLQPAGEALLARLATPPPDPRLVHGDLGPEHLRGEGDRLTAVIDWGDAGVGDPAYDADLALVARGRDYHLVGPWHEVLFGLAEGGPAYVERGLGGAVRRLEAVSGPS